jgi:hypothetical protein
VGQLENVTCIPANECTPIRKQASRRIITQSCQGNRHETRTKPHTAF